MGNLCLKTTFKSFNSVNQLKAHPLCLIYSMFRGFTLITDTFGTTATTLSLSKGYVYRLIHLNTPGLMLLLPRF